MKTNKKILNIGCREDIQKNTINLDRVKLKDVDVVHDLNKTPYPFPNETFDEIHAYRILEHLDDKIKPMKELNRILKTNGILKIKVPHFSASNTYSHPEHKQYYSFQSFLFYQDMTNNFWDFKFRTIKRKLIFGKKYQIYNYILQPIFNKIPHAWENTFLRGLFPAHTLYTELRKIDMKEECYVK